MAYTTINKSTEHFDTKVYTGNGSSQTLDMDNLGLLWMKNRTETSNHNLFDSVRGGYYTSAPGPNLRPNGTTPGSGSDITSAYGITFGSSSSTIGSDGGGYNYNQNGKSYVGWQWRANGTGVSNTDGSITSTVSANTTSGFSIVAYTGTGIVNSTVGHGLGAKVDFLMIKDLGNSSNWIVGHKDTFTTGEIYLNLTNALSAAFGPFNKTAPTTSVFNLGTDVICNGSGRNYVGYCFAEKKGFSKFGSYTGNGNADGPFIYTGFKPALVIQKHYSGAATEGWQMWDTKRNTYNLTDLNLSADSSSAEFTATARAIDILSNGFKCRGADNSGNASGQGYIYMAFAENPLVGTNGVPATAK